VHGSDDESARRAIPVIRCRSEWLGEIGHVDHDRGEPEYIELENADDLLGSICIAIRKIVSILGSIGVRPESERHRARLPNEPPLVDRTALVRGAPVGEDAGVRPTHASVAVSDRIGVGARLAYLG
jgi:hypothetical protein